MTPWERNITVIEFFLLVFLPPSHRMQLQPDTHGTMRNAVRYVWSTSGFGGFASGIVPRVLRRSLMPAVSWTVYEGVMKRVNIKWSNEKPCNSKRQSIFVQVPQEALQITESTSTNQVIVSLPEIFHTQMHLTMWGVFWLQTENRILNTRKLWYRYPHTSGILLFCSFY